MTKDPKPVIAQVDVPLYYSDEDGVQIYAEFLPSGKIKLSDLGSCMMRASDDKIMGYDDHVVRIASDRGVDYRDGILSVVCLDTEVKAYILKLGLCMLAVDRELGWGDSEKALLDEQLN